MTARGAPAAGARAAAAMRFEHAACRGWGSVFAASFDNGSFAVAQIRAVCAGCADRPGCLEYALDQESRWGDHWGFWGGHTAAERYRMLHPEATADP